MQGIKHSLSPKAMDMRYMSSLKNDGLERIYRVPKPEHDASPS